MFMNQSSTAVVTLEDLLAHHDERFIYNAYCVLLGRAPDPEGLEYYLNRIRAGVSKVEILAQLHQSKEGKSRLINIAGLDKAIKCQKILKVSLLGAFSLLAKVKLFAAGISTMLLQQKWISEQALNFPRGETKAARKLAQGYLRFHLDAPIIELVNVVKDTCVVSGWAVDLEAHSSVKVRVVVS